MTYRFDSLPPGQEAELRAFARTLRGRPKRRIPPRASVDDLLRFRVRELLAMIAQRLEEMNRPRLVRDPVPKPGRIDWELLAVTFLRLGDCLEDRGFGQGKWPGR